MFLLKVFFRVKEIYFGVYIDIFGLYLVIDKYVIIVWLVCNYL